MLLVLSGASVCLIITMGGDVGSVAYLVGRSHRWQRQGGQPEQRIKTCLKLERAGSRERVTGEVFSVVYRQCGVSRK